MKTLITILILSCVSKVGAAENLVCGISTNGKIIHTMSFDLDSDTDLTSSNTEKNAWSLNVQQNAEEGFVKISLGHKDEYKIAFFDRETLKSMKSGKSFGYFPSVERNGVVCFNMKEKRQAAFTKKKKVEREIASELVEAPSQKTLNLLFSKEMIKMGFLKV